MLEPVSVLTTVTTLIGVSYRLTTGVNALVNRYQQANLTLTTLATECSTTQIALTNIERFLRARPDFLSHGVVARGCLQTSIGTWASIFSVLDSELARINRGTPSIPRINIRGRMRFLLNEDRLKEISNQLRDLRSSIGFLLESAQT